jgi:hypothetical protein
MQLITLALTGKGSWAKVYSLLNKEQFDSIILLTNTYGKERFQPNNKTKVLEIDNEQPIKALKQALKVILKPEIKDIEVTINIDSGTGKEHTALICALIEIGVGINFITVENNEMIEL